MNKAVCPACKGILRKNTPKTKKAKIIIRYCERCKTEFLPYQIFKKKKKIDNVIQATSSAIQLTLFDN
ncbi:MAG: hypothetical protein IJW26_00755 [Clostridia bacterium]|nr:hypothetical protein [Clostridia bacterium]